MGANGRASVSAMRRMNEIAGMQRIAAYALRRVARIERESEEQSFA